ncbi:MAG: FAD:protein FMN transferase, partial [Burkholderiaceae bacterium]
VLAGAVLLDGGLAAHAAPRVQERRFLFGSPAEVLVAPRGEDAPVANAIAEVMAGWQRMNERWNAWKPGDVGTLNRAFAAGHSAATTPALLALIRSAAQLEAQSFGLFNAGIGGAVGTWGFHDDVMRPGARPDGAVLARWRKARPSLAQLEIRGHEVYSPNPQLQLDFGAYAKGVAIDWALTRLQMRGIDDALVNLGGNLAAMRCDGPGWRIGIRDPAGDGLIAQLLTQGREAVVTSGSYERFRLLDGERCTHILDPQTAAPAGELVSVTVVHACAARADAAATALLVAGRQGWRRVARRMGVAQVLIVDRHLRGEVTAPLAQRLQFADPIWRASISVV